MSTNSNNQLIAAILTLSQGLDALHEMMRKNLSYSVDQYGGKIPDAFIPRPLQPTDDRYQQWREQLDSSGA
ncbi:MAG: hypothetical protein JW709_05570 [Sedimentisphaerales bacterium]|nr:hypothetical protein [Sedimentisphaerales bacterium]